MRPVDKGKAPKRGYKKYQDAEADLESRLGAYCSFCEMSINHVPEVEHREAKSTGGELLEWNNLLLSCKYCNTRKGVVVKKGDVDKYLWPDVDDTFHAYSYDKDIPQLNEIYLNSKGTVEKEKAENLYHLLKLDNIPMNPSDKDRRYSSRNETRNCAVESKIGLSKMKEVTERKAYLNILKDLALAKGFFSVWMEVFKDDEEVKQLLISSFRGTKEEYCKEITY